MGCESSNKKRENQIKLLKQQTFFNETQATKQQLFSQNFQDTQQKVKLEFTLKQCCKNNSYQLHCEFEFDPENSYTSEIINCTQSTINFNTCFICHYYFSKRQKMRIDLIKNDEIVNRIFLYLGNIIGNKGSIYTMCINPNDGEFIIIKAIGLNNESSFLNLRLLVQSNIKINYTDPKNKFSFIITNNGKKIYNSESISSNGIFSHIKIPIDLLSPSFNITFLDCRSNPLSSFDTNTISFLNLKSQIISQFSISQNQIIKIYNDSELFKKFSFIEYIKNGIKLNLTIAIDFTQSNGNPLSPNSLHSIINNKPNDYENTIRECGYIVAYYDYDQLFPVYGFGAIINNSLSHCFNINFNNDPNIYTIDNVIKEYQKCLRKIQLSGPTYFSPVIKKTIYNIKKNCKTLEYQILMILTDGAIEDMRETMDAIVEGSFLPLSIIIIGIGNYDFSAMKFLDADKNPLVNSSGVMEMRDIVQFVDYKKYRGNSEKLIEEVLDEIPKQIVEYYTLKNIYPDNLQKININNNSVYLDNYCNTGLKNYVNVNSNNKSKITSQFMDNPYNGNTIQTMNTWANNVSFQKSKYV